MFFALSFSSGSWIVLFVLLPISSLGRWKVLSKYHKETPTLWSLWCFHSKLALLFTYTSFLQYWKKNRSKKTKGEELRRCKASSSITECSTSTFITTQGNLRGEPVRFLPEFIHTQTQSMSDSKTLGKATKTQQNKEAINPFLSLDVSICQR